MFRIACCLVVMAINAPAVAVWGQPALTHAVPAAVRPGQTTEITLHGSKLAGNLAVWTSHPAKCEMVPVPTDQKEVTTRVCKVTLDASVPIGIGGMVIGDASGSSDVLFLMVDDLPSSVDNGNNHGLGQAQTIAIPSAVDGSCEAMVSDYYKFAAKKDQRVSVEVVAARMASTLDSLVRVLDTAGKELLIADDDASFGADARFAFQAPADGDYVLEIRDNQFRAGGRYRLRIGDFPLVSAPYPLGGRFGSTTRFLFTGPLAESASPVFLRMPDDSSGRHLSIAAKFPSGKSSGMATIVASRLPDMVETEPNNEFKIATLTSLPCAVNGTFHEGNDRDYYQFAAGKGQSMQFKAVSRSMGSPSYLLMRIYNAEGAQLAESPINDVDETSFSFSFPADGMYALMVQDLLNRGGPEYAYRVEVEPNNGFSLTLKHDNNAKTKFGAAVNGGAFAFNVQVARRGYDGPIQLAPAEPIAGFTLHNSLIPAKVNEQRLIVSVAAGVAPGALHALRFVGSATVDGRDTKAPVHTTPTLKAKLPQVPYPPAWLDGLFVATTAPEVPPLFSVAAPATPVAFSRATAQSQFNVTLERKNAEFKEAIMLVADRLPTGFSMATKPDKDTYQITLTGPKEAAKGRSELPLLAYGELKGIGQIVRLNVAVDVMD